MDIREKLKTGFYEPKTAYARRNADPARHYAWREESNKLAELFKGDAIESVGLTNHPKAQACWDIAWDERHSSGRGEVLDFLEILSTLFVDAGPRGWKHG